MECIWSWRSLKSNWPKRRTLDSTCQKENINKRCENTPLTTALAAHASLVFMVELVRFSRAQHYCFGQIYWFHLMGETHVACTMLAIGQRAMNLLKMPSCRFSICSSIEQKKKVTEFYGLQSKRSGRCVDGNYWRQYGHAMKIHFGIRIKRKQNPPYHRMLIVRLHMKWSEFLFLLFELRVERAFGTREHHFFELYFSAFFFHKSKLTFRQHLQ